MSWLAGLIVAFGLLLLVDAYLIRTGRDRRWARWYLDLELPSYIRNIGFVVFPAGLSALFAGISQGAKDLGIDVLGVVFALLALPFGAATLIALFRPPEILKPEWVKQRESLSGDSATSASKR